MTETRIDVNVLKPVEYLACCGIFEIVSRFDEAAVAHWQCGNTTTFILSASFSDDELSDIIGPTLTNWDRWKVMTCRSNEVTRLEVTFLSSTAEQKLQLDWWYESFTQSGEINKSGWKMYAGQQKAEKIALDMVQKCSKLGHPGLNEILRQTAKVSGSYGFDPGASRNALDVGFSFNDLNLPVVTNPFAQLLAMFGAQTFFTPRTGQSSEIVSSRGWTREERKYFFDYSLWLDPVPIALARSLANAPAELSEGRTLNWRSHRATRDKYSNLTLAFPK